MAWYLYQMVLSATATQRAIALWPVYLWAALIAAMLLWRLYRPAEWWLLPGALLVRTSTWRSDEWTLHVMRRADSVIVYWADIWTLAIASRDGQAFSRRLRQVEAEVAIRAWLSSQPTPAEETLVDLR